MASLDFTPVHEDDEVYSITGKALKLTTAENIKPYIDDLLKLKKVTKIDFSGNTIGIEASKSLADAISHHSSIYENVIEVNFADLYTSRLVDEVVESLKYLLSTSGGLLKCSKLEILNLSDNALGLRTIDILEKFIANAIQLKHLILSNNGMGPFAGERIGKALYTLAQNKKKQNKPMLETFICGRNRLENGSAVYLALGLKSHGDGLRCVKLYQNGIRPRGIATLLKYGLKYNSKLEILDLQDNTFTSTASLILAETLPVWKHSLRELNVNDCLLKTPGCDAVLKVFSQVEFVNLAKLKLQYNEMAHETLVNELIPALKNKKLPSLNLLELNGNRLLEDSDDLDELANVFGGEIDDLDDLEELDSEDEDEEDADEDNEEELEDIDTNELEKALDENEISKLTEALEDVHI
ncbi:related to Ran GTPase-activating protein 1 [Saccharomycodes ludwigii]|uniref:Related to Ran GTPase-activating protein 1 n=1 Tax=Saccharomycodes ludwigii TaxID=36035 RepID=A0A376B428_9ASCO|nr:hypothetical protein SCDLUD_000806 [Saccharomycodes ludwigii]KAH3903189.1 hypothetical protein SCDLUD_000806 [Saccharomycodes ludwigii]SSD59445.1 related to Ran GTPase-activating protein 1 [Saccharomycodes ludwigii]